MDTHNPEEMSVSTERPEKRPESVYLNPINRHSNADSDIYDMIEERSAGLQNDNNRMADTVGSNELKRQRNRKATDKRFKRIVYIIVLLDLVTTFGLLGYFVVEFKGFNTAEEIIQDVVHLKAKAAKSQQEISEMKGNSSDQTPWCNISFEFQQRLLETTVTLANRIDILENIFYEKINETSDMSNKVKEEVIGTKINIEQLHADLRKTLKNYSESLTQLEKDIDGSDKKIRELIKESEALHGEREKENNKSISKLYTQLDIVMQSTEAAIDRISKDLYSKVHESETELWTFINESTKPDVAFRAYEVSNASPGRNQKLVFLHTDLNAENCYNTSTGEFIAPVDGLYWFTAKIRASNKKSVMFAIMVNGNSKGGYTYLQGSGSSTSSTIATLMAGDRVYVQTGPNISHGQVIYQEYGKDSSFQGTLIN